MNNDDFIKLLFQFMGAGITVVLIGVLLKDANGVSSIMTGFSTSYSKILSTLEGAG